MTDADSAAGGAPAVPAAAPAPEAAAAPVLAPVAPGVPKTDAIVDLWFAECVQGTPVGRYTDAYNAIYAAKEELKRRLTKET